ncbi:hypothetical protein DFQ29_007287 [Apophysomyces sp. BC1021]|nr:hypothetical protein DFQ29_007287 [Apophysomyces sp. BC1021]
MAVGDSSVFFVECGQRVPSNAFSDVSAALAASAVASLQTEEKANVPKKKTKRLQSPRDSLARRTQLLVGKDGSRRRQRWDNTVLYSEDLRPPGYGDRPTFHWVHDNEPIDELLESVIPVDEDDAFLESTAPLSRKARQMLKKSRVPKGLVSLYEQRLLTFMKTWRERSDEADTNLIFEISNPFTRFKGDDRFKLGEDFMDYDKNDDNSIPGDEIAKELGAEKDQSMGILKSMFGNQGVVRKYVKNKEKRS